MTLICLYKESVQGADMRKLKALILSGGGGRGAFHAGVYKYLMQAQKTGVEADYAGVWDPQVVVGTSIGAVNGAAIVQGASASELEQFWIDLQEKDIEGLPPGMRSIGRWMARTIFREIIGANLPQVPPEISATHPPAHFWSPLPILPGWLGERLIGRWINLLDTGPLRQTLVKKMGFDPEKLAASQRTLLIAATNVQTGERTMFSNRPIVRHETGEVRADIYPGIDVNRIVASCSIPLVYPWTYDKPTNAYYWDGAVVANTPLGSAFDAFGDEPMEVPAEVVVVLMTPWWKAGEKPPRDARQMPESFGDAITWALDWVLLASFRERLKLIEAYNRFAEQERAQGGGPYHYRKVNVMIVAPSEFLPAERIIDYDRDKSIELIQMGYEAAEKVFKQNFGV
jgi:NTE family protein